MLMLLSIFLSADAVGAMPPFPLSLSTQIQGGIILMAGSWPVGHQLEDPVR